ncbi:MAG: OmpA family protein, partial [Pseudomonadota bacterium]
ARLDTGGRVGLSDTTFNIEGAAASPRAYTQILDALRDRLPAGWTLGERAVTAPDVETYTWSFDRLGDDVVLNGYVPDVAIRARLLAAAKARYPSATITDRMLVAGGAPENFAATAEAVINETTPFREVRVVLRNTKLTVTGLADTQRNARDVIGQIAGTASGYALANEVRALRTVPPLVSPYVWSLDARGEQVVLSGHVPDEAARAALLAAARTRFPDADISDQMTLGSGVPNGRDVWVDLTSRAIAATADLDQPTIDLRDAQVSVKGDTRDAELRDTFAVRLRGLLPAGFETDAAVSLVAPEVNPAEEEAARQAALAAKREDRARRIREREALVEAARAAAADREARRLAILEKKSRERAARIAARERLVQQARAAAAQRERERRAALRAEQERLAQAEETRRREAEEVERARRVREAELAAARRAEREARRKDYRLVAEFNGTPMKMWRDREVAQSEGRDASEISASDYGDDARDSTDRLVLSGKVGSSAMRIALRRIARENFDGGVVDRLEVIDGAPDEAWLSAARVALAQLSRLRNGALEVTNSRLELYGDATTGDAARAVRTAVDRATPGRFDVSSLVLSPKALEAADVEKVVAATDTVDAGTCGNVMNTLTSLAPINFDSERAEIKPAARATLDKLAAVALRCPKSRIRVAGHTDSRGPDAYNQKLSEERAGAVAAYLADKGVEPSRMRTRGLGETEPLVDNDTRANRARNRRIEFTVTEQ